MNSLSMEIAKVLLKRQIKISDQYFFPVFEFQ